MVIKNIDDLSVFLHDWYGEPPGSLRSTFDHDSLQVAQPLQKIWKNCGQLLRGNDRWFKFGTPSPLACQDGLAGPNNVHRVEGRLDFAYENQGNWSSGYALDDTADDPEVLSDWLAVEFTNTGHVPVGAKLSEYIVAIALQETVFFGWDNDDNRIHLDQNACTETIWVGAYFNAVGLGNEYETPSHRFRVNRDRTLLVHDYGSEYNGFAARRERSRSEWALIKQDPET